MIALGVVMGTHGVRGDLRVKLHNDDSDLLFELAAVQLYAPALPDVGTRWCELREVRPGGKGLLVRLAGVETMEAAQALRGAELRVPRSALPELEPGEFYHCDLPGLRVQDVRGDLIGTLERVVPYPAADVLRVVTARGAYEVPMREPYLREVDVAAGHVIVDRLEDLELEPAAAAIATAPDATSANTESD
jgi:16S rRNA processing protein RimM